MKPGPATSSVAVPVEIGCRDDVVGDVARLAPELLGEGERAVCLGIGPIARSHDGIDRVVAAGHRGERRCQQLGNDDERIGHETSIVPVRLFVRHPGFAGEARDQAKCEL